MTKIKTPPYLELHNELKKRFSSGGREILIPELAIKITRTKFHSKGAAVLPGKDSYKCAKHGTSFEYDNHTAELDDAEANGSQKTNRFISTPTSILDIHDSEFSCNKEFDYIIIDELTERISKDVIILFHGLNEKKWDKYLPWAYRLLKKTGKPVILFPLAFHMDRAPKEWSDAKQMNNAAIKRAANNPGNSHTSFINAAISSRLEANPQRFFWSGLQSYIDVSMLISDITRGRVAGISKGAGINIFGYSIGAYFSVILLMAGAGGLAENSKLFVFCGGPTLDRMYPISKYILDGKATSALGSYYLEHMNKEHMNKKHMNKEHMNKDFHGSSRLWHYLSDEHPEESYFKSMLLYHHYKQLREDRLREISGRIYAVALKQDEVIPPVEVLNTLKGELRDIDIKVDVEDFNYQYNHVTPFPLTPKLAEETNRAFEKIMDKASAFLG